MAVLCASNVFHKVAELSSQSQENLILVVNGF